MHEPRPQVQVKFTLVPNSKEDCLGKGESGVKVRRYNQPQAHGPNIQGELTCLAQSANFPAYIFLRGTKRASNNMD